MVWDHDFSIIRRDVIKPLRIMLPDVAKDIETEVSAVKQTFHDNLERNQDFWRSFSGKEAFMDILSNEFRQTYQKIRDIVNVRDEEIVQQSTDIGTKIANLKIVDQTLGRDLAKLDQKLKEIDAETKAKARELDDEESSIKINEQKQAQLTNEVELLQEQLAALPSSEEIEQQRADIKERVKNFESPFGTLSN